MAKYYVPGFDPVWGEFTKIKEGFEKLPQPGGDKGNKLVKFSADGMALETKSVDETVNEGIDAVDDASVGDNDLLTFVKVDGQNKSLKKQSKMAFQGGLRLNATQLNAGELDEARLPAASAESKGAIKIAEAEDMETGTDDTLAATPARVRAQVGAKVDSREKTAGSATGVRRFSPRDVKDMVAAHAEPSIPAATAAAPGKVALASAEEVKAGTDSAKAVTAAGLQSRIGTAEGNLAALNASGKLDPQRFMFVEDSMPSGATEGAFWLQSTTGRLRQYLKNKRLFLFSTETDANSLTVLRTDGTIDEGAGQDFRGFASNYAEYKSLVVTDTKVYILRSDNSRVDVYNFDDLSSDTPVAIPSLPGNGLPKAMAVRNNRIYIVGTTSGQNPSPWMRVTDLAGARQATEEFTPPAIGDDGMAATAGRLRFVVSGTVQSYDLSGNRQMSEEFGLHANNADPHGVEFVTDEKRVYVYDDDDTRLYVYDLAGARQEGEEIDTSSFVSGHESGAIGYLSTSPVWRPVGAAR